MICNTCKQERPDDWDCGGDCVLCMADCGDPSCLEQAYNIVKEENKRLRTDHRAVMKMALEALEYHVKQTRPIHQSLEAIASLRNALKDTK